MTHPADLVCNSPVLNPLEKLISIHIKVTPGNCINAFKLGLGWDQQSEYTGVVTLTLLAQSALPAQLCLYMCCEPDYDYVNK